jgi:hypothetical protein
MSNPLNLWKFLDVILKICLSLPKADIRLPHTGIGPRATTSCDVSVASDGCVFPPANSSERQATSELAVSLAPLRVPIRTTALPQANRDEPTGPGALS